nr:hypothetical protein KPHV_81270 [Kitasatospora purpeofusca]
MLRKVRDRVVRGSEDLAEPFTGRRHFGGRSEDSARETVPREIPSCRATARGDSPSARCNRRIPAQPSARVTLSSS